MSEPTTAVTVGGCIAELARLEADGRCIGYRVTVSGRPCFTLRYLVPAHVTQRAEDWPIRWPSSDFEPAAIDWHIGSDQQRQFASPAELLADFYAHRFCQFRWVGKVDPSFADDRRAALRQLLVADDAMRELLNELDTANLSAIHGHVLSLLAEPEAATQLWRSVRDSHRNLFLLCWVTRKQVDPSLSPTAHLRRIGCGRGLALRLRALPMCLIESLIESLNDCKDPERTVLALRRLAPAMARLQPIAPDGAALRLELLFKLCRRLASLDLAIQAGACHLPRRFELAIGQQHGRCDDYRYLADATPGPDWTPIDWMVEVYQAGVSAVVKASHREDVWRALFHMNRCLEWMGVVGASAAPIGRGISLKHLYGRAEAWLDEARTQAMGHVEWPCALRAHETAWRDYEAALQTGYAVVPLVSTTLLAEEGRELRNCLGTAYPPACASGTTRVFSLQRSGIKEVTVELAYRRAGWQVVQMKGDRNQDRIEELQRSSPLGKTVRGLAEFYSRHALWPYPPVALTPDVSTSQFTSREAFLDHLCCQFTPSVD